MQEIKNKECWWIAYSDDKEVVHFDKVTVDNSMQTSQPNLEEFTSEDEWKNRLIELIGSLPEELTEE